MNPGSGLSGFERGRYFDAPKDAGGNVIQPTALNEIKLDGQHPYVAVDLWEQYSLDRLREKESFIREALILLNAAKSHPKITPEDLAAIEQLSKRITDIIARLPEKEKGTDTIKKYLLRRKSIDQVTYERLTTTEAGARAIARMLIDEMHVQIGIIQDSDKIYINSDIASWKFEIQSGLETDLKSLGESLQSLSPSHEKIGEQFLTDLFAISKLTKLCNGLESTQKNAKGTAEYLDSIKVHLTDGQKKRIIAIAGKEYCEKDGRYLAQDVHDALVMYEALCAPEIMTIETEDGTIIHGYPVKTKYNAFPQSIASNIEIRYAIRRAIGAIRGENPTELGQLGRDLTVALAEKDPKEKRRKIKKLLEENISFYKEKAKTDEKAKMDDAGTTKHSWFAELMAINYLEGEVYSAHYDAGQIKKDSSGQPILGSSGYPIIDRFGGCAATYKFAVVTNAAAGMAKYSIPGEAERGDPGPPILRNILVAPLLPLDEYLFIEEGKRGTASRLMGMTLREAIFNTTSAEELEQVWNSSAENLINADEQVQGAIHEGWAFWEMMVKGMGIKFSKIAHVAEWSEGLDIEIDPSIETKLKGVSSGIEYWLIRDNIRNKNSIQKLFVKEFGSGTDWRKEYIRYKKFEAVVVGIKRSGGDVDLAVQQFQRNEGLTQNIVDTYKKIYNELRKIASQDFDLAEGWDKGSPGENDEYFMRFSERVFTRIFGIDIKQTKEGKYGEFVKEIFKNDVTDWIRTMKKFVIGLLVIGQIQLNKEAANIQKDDVLAIKAMLNYDFWHHEQERLSVKIVRAMRGISGKTIEFTGVGLFEQDEVNAIMKDAGVPRGVIVDAEHVWKRVQQIKHG